MDITEDKLAHLLRGQVFEGVVDVDEELLDQPGPVLCSTLQRCDRSVVDGHELLSQLDACEIAVRGCNSFIKL